MKIKWPSSYVVWDLETSGLDPKKDKILEIGCMVVVDGKVERGLSWILDNKVEIPQFITDINGIDAARIAKDGRPPRECLKEFLEVLGMDHPHLTHNGMRFDIPFLAEQCQQVLGWSYDDQKVFQNRLEHLAIDTAALMKARKLPEERLWNESFADFAKRVLDIKRFGVKYNVSVCCDDLGIDRSKTKTHRAMGDVELTNEIYKKLIAEVATAPEGDGGGGF